MASIVLAGIGAAVGGNITTTAIGIAAGRAAGSLVGGAIDQKIFGGRNDHNSQNRRLDSITAQNSSYGHDIQTVYGTVKLGGNIIWAASLKEHIKVSSETRGSKLRKVKYTHTDYTYTISFAIAVCAGPIAAIERIWADDILLHKDSQSIRIYRGTEEQMPDPLIESIEGIGSAPAYRGIAYIVFENFNITDFNNRLPHFTFEVRRALNHEESAENLVQAVSIIPGSGEFVYDTEVQSISAGDYVRDKEAKSTYFIQRGYSKSINCHNDSGKANCLLSLDQLKDTLPNVKWVAPIVSWFVRSLEGGQIMPGVEYNAALDSFPDKWKVANYTRMSAHQITKVENSPIYGGTTNDVSIVRYLKELKLRGYKIMFYPLLFVDQVDKPWRGRISCKASEIRNFFRGQRGYNEFILHYARLTAGLIDAFIIGSELRDLTGVHDDKFNFPAVQELVNLAREVRTIIGKNVQISYAADWSEYHHTNGGWYNIDPLWSCKDIDFIGIDAYFPLTEWQKSNYDLNEVIASWDKNEGYDFYYNGIDRNTRHKLAAPYAWKNIAWWWENEHTNPDGKKTPWQPKSKKIWFTEYGFPSVDLATNQPNIFYDPTSSESGLPYYSTGVIDFMAQRIGIEATEKRWKKSDMVENKFLWTWDARPYPTWPDRSDLWRDAHCWHKGHWIQGKFGMVTLAALLKDLSMQSGLTEDMIDVSKIYHVIEGFIINGQTRVRDVIEKLRQIYLFDVVEKDYKLCFIPRVQRQHIRVLYENLIPLEEGAVGASGQKNSYSLLQIRNIHEVELPYKISINFINRSENYNTGNQSAMRLNVNSKVHATLNIPMVMDNICAQGIVSSILYSTWIERRRYSFLLPICYGRITPSDVIEIMSNEEVHRIRVTNVELGRNYSLKISGVADDISIYKKFDNISEQDFFAKNSIQDTVEKDQFTSDAVLEIIDIPILPNENSYDRLLMHEQRNEHNKSDARIFIAASSIGENQKDHELIITTNHSIKDLIASGSLAAQKNAVIGRIVSVLPSATHYTPDFSGDVIVNLLHGTLQSIKYEELMLGKNIMLIGDEIIQFQHAELIDKYKYRLSILLRGLFGTEEFAQKQHKVGERVVLLDQNIQSVYLPSVYCRKKLEVSIADTNETDYGLRKKSFNLVARNLLPFSPTHLRVKKILKNGDIIVTWNVRGAIIDKNLQKMQFKVCLLKNNSTNFTIYTEQNEYTINSLQIKEIDSIAVAGFDPAVGDGRSILLRLNG